MPTAAHAVSSTSRRAWLSTVRDATRTQLWPLPTLAVVVAVVAGVLLPVVDAAVDGSLSPTARGALFAGGADAARTVLSSISGSLITVTSLTFSLTVVTLQLASSQFSPRLLRTFTRDRYVHLTLALFLSTFTYALTVLCSVRNETSTSAEFVPRVSVTVAFVLAVASVLGLVVFLAHLARQIRVETMLRTVHDDGSSTLGLLLDKLDADAQSPLVLPVPPPDAVTLLARASGFMVRVDESELLDAAVDAGAIVLLDRHPGSFLVADTPIGQAWPLDPLQPFDDDARERLLGCVGAAVATGFERTAAQDIGFALRQLTDVANKALSPGINDPTTAVHALGHSAALLCELAGRALGPRVLRDDAGRERVLLHRPTLADLVDVAVAQPRRYGASDPAVLTAIFVLLRELAWRVAPDQHAVVIGELARLRTTVSGQDFDDHENRQLTELGDRVEHTLRRLTTVA
jgi:uncharacterized membrane protein